MKIDPACFPCILNRLLSCAGRITDDAWLQHKLLGKAMAELSDTARDTTPAEAMCEMHGVVSKMLGSTDLLSKQREQWHQELAGVQSTLTEAIASADAPLAMALAFSARANVLDDETLPAKEVCEELNMLGLRSDCGDSSELTVKDDYDRFLKDLGEAETLLFLHDSGPELVVDRLLFEQLRVQRPDLRITSVVRQQAILLDATREDAERVGLASHSAVESVIDPGVHALGAPLNECSREFRDAFESADMVIAKGQAHVETLSGSDRRAYFLLRIKCGVMATSQGAKIGDTVLFRS